MCQFYRVSFFCAHEYLKLTAPCPASPAAPETCPERTIIDLEAVLPSILCPLCDIEDEINIRRILENLDPAALTVANPGFGALSLVDNEVISDDEEVDISREEDERDSEDEDDRGSGDGESDLMVRFRNVESILMVRFRAGPLGLDCLCDDCFRETLPRCLEQELIVLRSEEELGALMALLELYDTESEVRDVDEDGLDPSEESEDLWRLHSE